MNDSWEWAIAFAFMLSFGIAGWEFSAKQIGKECDKVGAFFVGDKVYDCKLRHQAAGAWEPDMNQLTEFQQRAATLA